MQASKIAPAVAGRSSAAMDAADRRGEPALVAAPRPPLQRGVREAVGLEVGEQLALVHVELHRVEPGAQDRPGVVRPERVALGAGARLALDHHALDHVQDGGGVGRAVVVAAAERANGERHRGVGPLGRGALVAVGADAAGAHVREELLRRGGRGRLGPGAPDVDPGVVVGPADAGAAVCVDVDRRRQVELPRAGAVADLPDREQLGEAAPVTGGERRGDGVEGVSERARDVVLLQVGGDRLDVARVGL